MRFQISRPLLTRAALGTALATALAAAPAQAGNLTDLIINGNFTEVTNLDTAPGGGNGEGQFYTGGATNVVGSIAATGWSACSTTTCNSADGGYPFIFIAAPGTANQALSNGTAANPLSGTGFADPWDDPSGTPGNASSGVAYRGVYGSGSGGTGPVIWNGYGPGSITSPVLAGSTSDTSNILIADAEYHPTAFSQTIGGQTDPTTHVTTPLLQIGDRYQLTFAWAAGQWTGAGGSTLTEQWGITWSAGANTQSATTPLWTESPKSFSGWTTATINFIATSTQETLTFLALASSGGDPPLMLLDDVSLYDIPEPAALGALWLGGAALLLLARRRR